jgi:HSP20 family protein
MNLKSLIPIGRERARDEQISPFAALRREIDRLFEDFSRGFPSIRGADLTPRMDVYETDKEIELTAELPGLEEKDVEINIADGLLTIHGEKKSEREEKDKNYRLIERRYGSFSRTVELPSDVDPDKIKATISKGILKVSIPKPPEKNVKKIEVKTAA